MCIIVLTHRCPLELIKNYLDHLKIRLNNLIHDPPYTIISFSFISHSNHSPKSCLNTFTLCFLVRQLLQRLSDLNRLVCLLVWHARRFKVHSRLQNNYRRYSPFYLKIMIVFCFQPSLFGGV